MGWSSPLIRRGECLACDTEKESPHFWDNFCIRPWKAGKMFGSSTKEYESFRRWTVAGRPEPPAKVEGYDWGVPYASSPASVGKGSAHVLPSAPSPPRRWLVWRGKRYEEALCQYCGRTAIRLDGLILLRGDRSYIGLKDPAAICLVGSVPCSKCMQRLADNAEKAASELRSACAGGTWTEPEAKP